MTGYASAQFGGAAGPSEPDAKTPATRRLGIEIRSVNSRFLDLSFRLPDELRQHEPALRELLTSKLKRGKVEVRAGIDHVGASAVPDPSHKLLQRLNGVQDTVRSWLPGATPLTVADVIRLAGGEQSSAADIAELGEQVVPLAEKALKELIASRQREGLRLSAMIASRN